MERYFEGLGQCCGSRDCDGSNAGEKPERYLAGHGFCSFLKLKNGYLFIQGFWSTESPRLMALFIRRLFSSAFSFFLIL